MRAKRKSNKKRAPGILIRFMQGLTGIAVLCLFVSCLARYTDPQTFWPVAFFGLAYPVLLTINVLFLLFWLFKKPRFMILLPLAAILAGWSILASSVGFRASQPEEKKQPASLRVMTYNVHYFKKFYQNLDTSTKKQILEIIREQQPDVLCIQEFFSRAKGAYNFKKTIRQVMQTDYFYFFPSGGNDYEETGLAVFSKYPIINSGHLTFPQTRPGNEAIFADIKYGKGLVRFYCVHLQSINFGPEDYTYFNEVKKDINTNMQSSRRIGGRLKRAFIKRSAQVKILKNHASGWNAPYVICGDFNDTPSSYAVNYVSDGMYNAFREKGSGLGITYNGDFPNFQIDYILTSKKFSVKNYQVIRKKLSDHYAVRSDLELNTQAK